MEDANSNIQCRHGYGEEFHDAPDDSPFTDCEDSFSERFESDDAVSISVSDQNPVAEYETSGAANLRRRRPVKSSEMEMPQVSSSDSYLYSRKRKTSLSRKTKQCKNKSENESSDTSLELRNDSDTLEELRNGSESVSDVVKGNNDDEKEEISTLTNSNSNNVGKGNNNDGEKEESSSLRNANNARGDSVRNELDLRENIDADSGLILTLAGLMVKAIAFQMELFVKFLWFPVSLCYYLFMLVFNPLGLLKCCRGHVLKVLKRIWNLVCENVSPVVNEWLKENKAFWKMGLKFGWGILWSAYVCTLLVTLLVSAFVIGGLVIRVAVEEPLRMQSNLNFDYTEKSPVAFVPVIAYPGMRYDIRIGDEPEIGKVTGLRIIPYNHKLQATVALTLPESDYNQNLGIFQVRVDFLDYDGKTLASLRRPCMLHFKSQPIRLLLTFLKMVPILTGYTSETQNLKVSFRGFSEGSIPTASLRVVIEQRAEFRPGAGIPEIYAASLTLKSELPLFKKIIWFWKKTLFVWISLFIFMMELVFALLCCRPLIMPRIRLRGDGNQGASTNERPV